MFLPLGVRTISGVMLQIDKSLEECAQMCGAGWGYRIRTVTVPLLWPGLIAAWLLLFVASIRELGASILLMGPHSKVITPSIVESWFASSTELTAAMALIQTLVVAVAVSVLLAVTRRATDADYGLELMAPERAKPHIEVEDLDIHYGEVPAVRGVSFSVQPGEQLTLLGPSGCGKTTSLRAIAGLEQPSAGEIRIGGAPVYSSAQRVNIPAEKRGLSMVFQSYAIWPHMTVFENVAYGLRVRRESKRGDRREGRARARHGADARLQASAAPRSSPAGSSSASRWRAPSCSSPRCCCSTSRSRTSTPSCAPTCASSCASCSTGSASRRST